MLRFMKVVCLLVLMCLPCMVSSQEDIPKNWWDSNAIVVRGYGLAPKNIHNVADARTWSRRAALVDGYRQMAEQINGVQITSETTIRDGIISGDIIQTKVNALIRGAKILSEDYGDDGSCSIVMTIPVYGGKGSVASLAFKPVEKEDFPEPTTKAKKAKGNYTGLIIDCGDLELSPVLAPVIREDKKDKDGNKQSIYGYSNLDYNKVVANGMIDYAKVENPEDNQSLLMMSSKFNLHDVIFLRAYAAKNNKSRAGDNPLVIKAKVIDDGNSTPVVSIDDADRILLENQESHFLDEGAVVFTGYRVGGVRA